MMRRVRSRLLTVAVAGLLLAPPGRAHAAPADEGGRNVDPQAMKVIQRMSEYLSRLQQFSVTIETGYDIVQEWGQKIEFGETRVVTVRRPDRLRVDVANRDGSASGMVFDGKQIAVFDRAENVWATADKPGTIEGALKYFVQDLGMRLPMAGILSAELPKEVAGWATSIRYVERSTIRGIPSDLVTLSGNWDDVQLWVAQGDKPLLQRMVITYTRAEGKPQFWAQLESWNLSPDTPDSTFAFQPPEGAAKIEFAPLVREYQFGAAGQGGKQR